VSSVRSVRAEPLGEAGFVALCREEIVSSCLVEVSTNTNMHGLELLSIVTLYWTNMLMEILIPFVGTL